MDALGPLHIHRFLHESAGLGGKSLSCQELYSSLNVGGDAEGNRESLEIS